MKFLIGYLKGTIINNSNKIPYAYVSGAELKLLGRNPTEVLESDDGIHQVLTSLRSRLVENPTDSLNILDSLASQFGIIVVDSCVANSVREKCGFQEGNFGR